MTANQPNLVQSAKQGNVKAIEALLNSSLRTKGITAKASLKDGCLQLVLEAKKAPEQQALIAFLQKGLTNLDSAAFQTVKIYGKQTDEEFPSWINSFDLRNNSSDKLNPLQSEHTDQKIQQNQGKNSLESELVILKSSLASKKSRTAASQKVLKTPSRTTSRKQPNNNKPRDYGYESLEFLSNFLKNWTLLKTGQTLIIVGGILLIISLPSCNSSTSVYSGIKIFLTALVLLGLGCYCLQMDNHQKAEKTVSSLVKEAIKEFQQKASSIEIVSPNEFREIDNLNFAVAGVSYEAKIVASYDKEYLGSVAVGDENWAASIPIAGKKPVHIDITGKGVVIEITVHNNQKINDKLTSQSFCLIDQHLNRYSEHPMSAYVSTIRQGITNETNLRPNMKAKYFVVFDINPDSVALMLATRLESGEQEIVFSLDLEQKIVT
ncbi:hypothetical protein [Geitlerinema sp. PCC 7407]|uniref:hypothetical protein n=1 Tax=Geitlerinema sp. PCC 7407 TaxID=1173025 RepID=UPI00029FD052|nr:hypothetical protein [Geitlerinema sp. PCC 7407]AFY64665.1 hypothetical protein GEI7407_0160 [Geitlerinema sp. PCC 7407]